MARPKTTGATCRRCGTSESEGATISKRRLCPPCGEAEYAENVREIARREGPGFTRWVVGMAAAVERIAAQLG